MLFVGKRYDSSASMWHRRAWELSAIGAWTWQVPKMQSCYSRSSSCFQLSIVWRFLSFHVPSQVRCFSIHQLKEMNFNFKFRTIKSNSLKPNFCRQKFPFKCSAEECDHRILRDALDEFHFDEEWSVIENVKMIEKIIFSTIHKSENWSHRPLQKTFYFTLTLTLRFRYYWFRYWWCYATSFWLFSLIQ